MGVIRNGARSALNILNKACKLSHLPGFQTGINQILGGTVGAEFFIVWNPLCAFIETLVAADNFYNQIDYLEEVSDTEDIDTP